MRCHYILLPALAGLVFANNDASSPVTNEVSPTSDELPVEELRDIQVTAPYIAKDMPVNAAVLSESEQDTEANLGTSMYPRSRFKRQGPPPPPPPGPSGPSPSGGTNGAINGYNGPQNLGTKVMNAPLYDCTNTWTYLGFKLLQTTTVDPNLCATACDAQTSYNKDHPPKTGKTVTCNGFGSYMLTRTNSTGSYPLAQMCTMYTAYWDEKFAVNSVAYDDKIRAKYTYSSSTFYGKKDVQPACGSKAVSGSGTYVDGGSAP